jgi:endonuclease/exonuclease/phosphatase family metal-dependent hydrolase
VTVKLRVATYNIRKALGTDRRRDPDRILAVIADLGADICLLQEADFRLPPRPPVFDRAMVLDRTGLVALNFDHGRDSLGWHGNAILARPDLHMTARRHFDLPGIEPRGGVMAELEVEGQALRVLGVHLGLLRRSRRQQLTALNRIMGQGADMPTLIAGDFNERSLAVGLGRLAPRFRILAGGPTYHSRHPLFALDRIAVTGGLTAADIRVFRNAEASRASDHLPLVADLVLTKGQSIAGTT